jgi:hypothetical protein
LDLINIGFTVMSLHTIIFTPIEDLDNQGVEEFSLNIKVAAWIAYALYVVRTVSIMFLFGWASICDCETVARRIRASGCLVGREQSVVSPQIAKENFLLSLTINSYMYIPLFIFFGEFGIEFERITYDFRLLSVIHFMDFVKITLSFFVNATLILGYNYGSPDAKQHHNFFLFSCIFTTLRLVVVLYVFFVLRSRAKIASLMQKRATKQRDDLPELLYRKTDDGDLDVSVADSSLRQRQLDRPASAVVRRTAVGGTNMGRGDGLPKRDKLRSNREDDSAIGRRAKRQQWSSKEATPADAQSLIAQAMQASTNSRLTVLWGQTGCGDSGDGTGRRRTKQPAAAMVKWEVWEGIWGSNITALTSNASYYMSASSTRYVPTLALPMGYIPPNSGSRLSALFVPSASGEHVIFMCGEGESELWLAPATGGATLNRVARATEAEDGKYQCTCVLSLELGSKYVMQVLYKCGDRSGFVAVSLQLPDGTMECPLSSKMLRKVDSRPIGGMSMISMIGASDDESDNGDESEVDESEVEDDNETEVEQEEADRRVANTGMWAAAPLDLPMNLFAEEVSSPTPQFNLVGDVHFESSLWAEEVCTNSETAPQVADADIDLFGERSL